VYNSPLRFAPSNNAARNRPLNVMGVHQPRVQRAGDFRGGLSVDAAHLHAHGRQRAADDRLGMLQHVVGAKQAGEARAQLLHRGLVRGAAMEEYVIDPALESGARRRKAQSGSHDQYRHPTARRGAVVRKRRFDDQGQGEEHDAPHERERHRHRPAP